VTRRAALLALVFVAGARAVCAQTTIRLDDAGPGASPRILGEALARPYDVVPPAGNRFFFDRETSRERTTIVVGRDAVVDGTIHGDLIVVGGDLYTHPGSTIDGRAIAYGGGVYTSALGTVRGGVLAFHDFTYDATRSADTLLLRYRELNPSVVPMLALGGLYGVNVPSYDRTNGVSLPLSVVLVPGPALRLEGFATYRSQLGRLDPWIDGVYQATRRSTLRVGVGRGTFTNESWIRTDLLNSIDYLLSGDDARNYYRSTRADARIERTIEGATATLTPFFGLRVGKDDPARPGIKAAGGP